MHAQRPPTNPPQLVRILDRFRSAIHVAPTARRESHSGLVSSLKETQRGHPEQRKECESPDTGRAKRQEDSTEHQGGTERHDAEAQAALPAARTDIRDGGDAYGLVSPCACNQL